MSRRRALVLTLIAASLGPAAAQGYSLRESSDGVVLVWQQAQQHVEFDTSLVAEIPGATAAVHAAFATWLAGGVPMKLTLTPATERAPVAHDGRNVVTWAGADWAYTEDVVAMTVSLHRARAAAITETDIVLNGRLGWSTAAKADDMTTFDIQNVLTHEVGHFLGLGHEPAIVEAAMYPYTPPGETRKRRLHDDDRAGLSALTAIIHERAPAGYGDDDDNLGAGAMGCAVGGAPSGAWALFAPLLIGTLMRRRRWLSTLLLVGLLTAAGSAHATIVEQRSIAQLSRSADLVVQARIIGQHSSFADGLIVTDHYLVLLRGYSGDGGVGLTLRTLGGQVGDRVVRVAGSPRLAIGDTIIAFARWRGGVLLPVGLSLGLFRVEGDRAVRDTRGLHVLQGRRLRALETRGFALEQLERAILDATRPRGSAGAPAKTPRAPSGS